MVLSRNASMNTLDLHRVAEFVNQNIDTFHQNRLAKIQGLALKQVLKRKNPYLFRAKNATSAAELVASILDATVSSSEEELFGEFLEQVAIFINQMTYGGQKSSTKGIDLDFTRDGVRYLVAIKSGPNWGNSDQKSKLNDNFKNALKVLRQSRHVTNAQAVLGTCYGKNKTTDNGLYRTICGQNFWEFISGDPELYIKLIEPLGYEAKRHNDHYVVEKNNTYNRFVREFTNEFCDEIGQINWAKLVHFNSGNLTTDR